MEEFTTIKDVLYLPSGRVFLSETVDGYLIESTEMRDVSVNGKEHESVRNSLDPHVIWKHLVDTDWDKLKGFLSEYYETGKVSVSGGGDSLYNFEKHSGWWDKFFNETNELNMLVDVHTREKFYNNSFWGKINRCVFSSDSLLDDIIYLDYLKDLTKIRITHLVTEKTTDEQIKLYLSFQEKIGCEFTIKELVGFDDGGRYEEIKRDFPEIFYLDKGDYNIYYMPDNSIRNKFLEDVVVNA